MNWDSPMQSKVFLGAASLVLVAGWIAVHLDRAPALSAPQVAAREELRDAVASPALPLAPGVWLQAAGAGALGRAARMPSLRELKPVLPPRPTSGRTAFPGGPVLVDGIPNPAN